MAIPQAVPGMNDVLPREVVRWRALEDAFRSTCERYGYREVRTPVCEYTELFQRSIGEVTDIVQKEMYTFTDAGERSLTLRPEGTAGAARAALEHAVLGAEPVARWFYLGPMFRAEKPARGRFREFHQVGAECYGDDSPAVDAEAIDLAVSYLHALGISRYTVRVNSIGSAATRAAWRESLVAYFAPLRETLSPESQARLTRNPMRILDSKDPRDLAVIPQAPSVLDALSPEDRAHFDKVLAFLDALGTTYTVDPGLVRGLDYYTRTVFEIVDTSDALGAQNALGGGGRYDGLFTELSPDAHVPAVGFAMGVERLLLAAPVRPVPTRFAVAVVAAARSDETSLHAAVLALAHELRTAGVETYVDTRFKSMKSQMRRVDDLGARLVLVLGGNELARGTVTVRDMAAHLQTDVDRGNVVAHVRSLASTAESSR